MKTWFIVSVLAFAAPALADDEHATAGQLAALAKKQGAAIGVKKTSTLESPDFVDVAIKKGYCYAVEVKLAPDASWKADRSPMLFVPAWPDNPTSVGAELRGSSGAVFVPGCAEKSDKLSLGLNTYGPEDKVGTGAFTMVVYERKGSGRELAAESSARKQAHADSIRERDERHARDCGECASKSATSDEMRICLQRIGLQRSDCNL